MNWDYFDKIYCIHLPHQVERKELLIKEFDKAGINGNNVQFVYADPPPDEFQIYNMARNPVGEFGCNLSQTKAVVKAIADGAKRPLFLEDDITFVDNANEKLKQFLDNIPPDWDILYLGGHPRGEYSLIKPNVAKISKFSFAEAYCIKQEHLYAFFEYWTDYISKPVAPFDFILGNYAGKLQSYSVFPVITRQRPGYSGISEEYEDKSHLLKTRWQRWKK